MFSLGTIEIKNKAEVAEIDIEGIIGIPEWWQFDNPEEKVSTYDKFKDAIKAISEIDSTDVVVNIRSLGGDVNDALLIHDTLASLKGSVSTNCYGYTASAATIIAQAASKDKRHISENALYLIHRASTYAEGNAEDMEEALGTLRKSDEVIASIYSKRSGKDKSSFEELMSENGGRGKWLTAQEAVEFGLADQVVRIASPTNYSTDDIKAFGLPEIPKNITEITNNHKKMKVKNTLASIRAFLGWDSNEDHELTDEHVEKIDGELSKKELKIKDYKLQIENLEAKTKELEDAHSKSLTEKEDKINELTAQVSNLLAENAKLKEAPTRTEDREDPSVGEGPKDDRACAYDKDVANFK